MALRHYAEFDQRTPEGAAFDRKLSALLRASREQPELIRSLDEGFARLQATPGMVGTTQTLTELSLSYANDDYIGDRLMPPVPVSKLAVEYFQRPQESGLSYPADTIGTDGSVNEVSERVTLATAALTRRSLKEHLDAWTLELGDSVALELIDPLMNVLDGLALGKEQRQAAILTAAGSYGANTAAIAAANRWNTQAGGDPVGNVLAAKAACWTGNGPGRWVAFCGVNVYNALKTNARILDQVKYTGGDPAVVGRQQIAALFEVDELLVGMARQNTANEGAAAVYTRMWDANNSFGLVRVANRPSRRSASFGITLQIPMQTTQWFEQGRGGRGSYIVQASHADAATILAAPCGFLYTTVI
jgi:hypothetical protein